MLTLHYAPNPTGENMSEILHIECDNFEDLIVEIEYETELKFGFGKIKNDIVYLCSFEDLGSEKAHILIDRNPGFIVNILEKSVIDKDFITDVWLFTFNSFEDAYKTALDMKEGCYYDSAFTYEPKSL